MKIVFDVETNGLFDCSVLSFSAIILDKNNNIIEEVDRYYFKNDNEEDNQEALNINGLYEEVIKDKRKNAKYPKHFKYDKYIIELFNKCDTLIAHNIEFDLNHIVDNFQDIKIANKKQICTMRETQYYYNAPYQVKGKPKFPNLKESADFCKVDFIKIQEETKQDFHSSLFDVYVCLEIYKNYKKIIDRKQKQKGHVRKYLAKIDTKIKEIEEHSNHHFKRPFKQYKLYEIAYTKTKIVKEFGVKFNPKHFIRVGYSYNNTNGYHIYIKKKDIAKLTTSRMGDYTIT